MKKLIFLFTTMALALVFSGFAQTGGKMIVKIERGETAKNIHLQLANLQHLRTGVAILDMEGKYWFNEYVWSEKGYAANLNLRGMPAGDYVFEIKNKDNRYLQAFSIGTNDLAFFKEMPAEKPAKSFAKLASLNPDDKGKLITHFTDEGNSTLGVQLANLQHNPALVRMVAFDAGTMLSKRVAGVQGYAEKWNLTGLASANYLLYVRSGDANVVLFFQLNGDKIELQNIQRLDFPANIEAPADEILSAN